MRALKGKSKEAILVIKKFCFVLIEMLSWDCTGDIDAMKIVDDVVKGQSC